MSALPRKLAEAVESAVEIAGRASAVMLLLVTGLMLASVVARYILRDPLTFTDEVIGYLGLALASLGFAYAMKSGSHVQVTLLVDHLGSPLRHRVQRLQPVVGLAWAGAFFLGALFQFDRWYNTGTRDLTNLMLPLWIPAIPLVLGSGLLLLQLLATLIGRRPGPGGSGIT